MKKPRIAIRAFTCRRDVAPALLLAALLERRGCDVLVTCVRDFVRTLRTWKPEVAVFNTPGIVEQVRAHSPQSKAVFLEGEGFLPSEMTRGVRWQKRSEEFEDIDMVFMWGKRAVEDIRIHVPDANMDKVRSIGNPSLDLVRFLPETASYDPRANSVGIATRFNSINDHRGSPPTRTLPNPGNLERVIVQCRAFVGLIDCIRTLLEQTDYRISIRPHPLEQKESYENYKQHWFGVQYASRVEVDDSLSFSQWALNQKYILSPTSTSLLEAYLLKVPVINADILCNTDEYNRNYATMSEEWQAAGLNPRSHDELVEMVKGNPPAVREDPAIEQQLREYCDIDEVGSACLAAAEEIAELAVRSPTVRGGRLPTWLVDSIDRISFNRAYRKDPLHANMHYRRGHHAPPQHLNSIVDNIVGHT